MTDEPMKVVIEFSALNLLNDIANDPLSGVSSTTDIIMEKINPMFDEVKRYPQPFKAIGIVLSCIFFVPFVLTVLAAIMAYSLAFAFIKLADYLNTGVLNLITQSKYKVMINEHFSPHFADIKRAYLEQIRIKRREALLSEGEETEELDNVTEENLYNLLINEKYSVELERLEVMDQDDSESVDLWDKIEEQFKQKIIDDAPLFGLTKLKIVIDSLYLSVTSPLSQYQYNKWVALFLIKPLQAFSSLFIVPAASLVELARYVNIAGLIIATGLATLQLLTGLVIVNSPLYAVDLGIYIFRKINNPSNPSVETAISRSEAQADKGNNNGPKTLLRLTIGGTAGEKQDKRIDFEPVPHASLEDDENQVAEEEEGSLVARISPA